MGPSPGPSVGPALPQSGLDCRAGNTSRPQSGLDCRPGNTSRQKMLKHKIRKSRKNILTLLEGVSFDEKQEKPDYTKVNKKDKKHKEKIKGNS